VQSYFVGGVEAVGFSCILDGLAAVDTRHDRTNPGADHIHDEPTAARDVAADNDDLAAGSDGRAELHVGTNEPHGSG
jgi:hypothetical protein